MSLFGLALASLRHRAAGFAASLLSLFLGATILMTFASLLDTRLQADVTGPAGKSLVILAGIVGGWGLVIVGFATMSTLGLLVRQRAAETALLRSVGATPRQVGGMIVAEAAVLAVVASAAAVVPAVFTGRLLVDMLKDGRQLPPDVTAAFGPVAIGAGLGITLLAAVLGATGAVWRTTRSRVREAMVAASAVDHRSGVARTIVGGVLVAGGVSCAVVTMTVFTGDEPALMAVGGQGAILSAIGLALLGRTIIGVVASALAGPLRRLGVGGHLASLNLRGRVHELATGLAPIVLFTAIGTGTLYMQAIENAARAAPKTDIAGTVETLNYVVVGMITLFAGVLLVNTMVAATIRRRREFGQLRLVGSTPPEVLRMVGFESVLLAALGVLVGTAAATVTVIPYSIAKTGDLLPDSTITTYVGIVALAATLTLTSGLLTTHRAMTPPPVQAATTDM